MVTVNVSTTIYDGSAVTVNGVALSGNTSVEAEIGSTVVVSITAKTSDLANKAKILLNRTNIAVVSGSEARGTFQLTDDCKISFSLLAGTNTIVSITMPYTG